MERGRRRLASFCLLVSAGLTVGTASLMLWTTSALAHQPVGDGRGGSMAASARTYAAVAPEMYPVDPAARARAAANPGPCTAAAADAMPDGDPHDHNQIAAHRAFSCGLEQSAFLPLKEELRTAFGREDVMLGEMDVKADIAAVGIAYPRAGIAFFDVADPANPKLLSIYRGGECDAQPSDVDCGAFVDLSFDAKVAYMAVQNTSSLPDPSPTAGRPGVGGVEVINLADPRRPQLVQTYPAGAGFGVHTARSHVIPAEGPGPRAPGEYVFAFGHGVEIMRVTRPGGVPQMTPVTTIDPGNLHDTFIQNDPTDNRTYLYVASGMGRTSPGQSTGGAAFVVYDVTDPAQAKLLAQWDLTPECETDWYSHTIDVTTRNGRRYVTLPPELFLFARQSSEDRASGCGENNGNGDKVGPMWIVDATDFKALPQPTDPDAEIKRKSEEALVATWENPAGRAGGQLTFSPHNQQIVGDKIYLSHYHGGVYVLDASKAFDGVKTNPSAERPREVAFVVPSGEPMRADISLFTRPVSPFFTSFPFGHPSIWDMFFWKGHLLVADITGGFYSYREIDPGTASGQARPGGTRGPGPARARRGGRRFVISRRSARMSRRGVVGVRVACRSAAPCRGAILLRTAKRLRAGRRQAQIVLARESFVVRGGRRVTLRIRLPARNRRLVSRLRRTRVVALATIRPAGGEPRLRATARFSVAASR